MQIKKTIMLWNMPPGTSKPLRPCHCPFQNFDSPYHAHLNSSWAPYHAQWLVLGTYVLKYSTLYHCMRIFCTLPVPGTYVSGYGMLYNCVPVFCTLPGGRRRKRKVTKKWRRLMKKLRRLEEDETKGFEYETSRNMRVWRNESDRSRRFFFSLIIN